TGGTTVIQIDRDFQRVLEEIDGSVDFEAEYYNEAYLSRRISARMRRRSSRPPRGSGRSRRRCDFDPEETNRTLILRASAHWLWVAGKGPP
ncbi:MAG: hypothetical protein R6V25_09420, partial [Desulfatiglandales bacterium]